MPSLTASCSCRPAGSVVSVNVGSPRTVEWHGARVTSGIWKSPVNERIPVRGVNLAGDDQADRTVHGGPDKAVYAYAAEDYDWWAEELGRVLAPATFGENLTIRGLAVSTALVGERWRVGSVLLEVAQPRLPCYKLGMRMNDARFPSRFTAAGRPGAYLRIVEEGELAAGDHIDVIHRPKHDLTVADVSHIYLRDRRQVYRLLEVSELPESWQQWARKYSRKRA